MIKGLDQFTKHFAGSAADFVVVGGVAAHEIMGSEGLTFRATKDIDLVIIARPATAFCHKLVAYINAGLKTLAPDFDQHALSTLSGSIVGAVSAEWPNTKLGLEASACGREDHVRGVVGDDGAETDGRGLDIGMDRDVPEAAVSACAPTSSSLAKPYCFQPML